MDRNEAIARIRAALKKRSGKNWGVTGGRGTAWGWITVTAPPARCTWKHVPKPHNVTEAPGIENWDEIDTGKPGSGHMGPSDRDELALLMGLDRVCTEGISIPASSDYQLEHVDRAEGRTPTVTGKPYWD